MRGGLHSGMAADALYRLVAHSVRNLAEVYSLCQGAIEHLLGAAGFCRSRWFLWRVRRYEQVQPGAALRSTQGGNSCGGQRIEEGHRSAYGTDYAFAIHQAQRGRAHRRRTGAGACRRRPARYGRSLMILIGMFDSPFVRRVAVSMNFLQMPFENPTGRFAKNFN